jgi:hypothetical protein
MTSTPRDPILEPVPIAGAWRRALVGMVARETAYPVTPRLRTVELPRTTNQLRHPTGRMWRSIDGAWTQRDVGGGA